MQFVVEGLAGMGVEQHSDADIYVIS